MATFKFNRSSLAKIEPPSNDPKTGTVKNQLFHWDSQQPGFGIRVTTTGHMSYVYTARVNGKKTRFTIGAFSAFTPEQARKEAQKLAHQIGTGINPKTEKQRRRLEGISLAQAVDEYKASRKTLKDSTRADMTRVLNQVVPDWMDKPITGITPDMVTRRHSQHGQQRSEAKANGAMRYLRAVFNYALATYTAPDGQPILKTNPVTRLSQTRAWFENRRRQNLLTREQLQPWLEAVRALPQRTVSDYLVLILFTGLRKTEGLTLRWADVDMVNRTLTVRDTKNHKDHTLPLSEFLHDLLQQRQAINEGSPFVFPGSRPGEHYKGPSSRVFMDIEASTGIRVSAHDLRRTFATIAESLETPSYALKALLNHKTTSDVTAGYIIRNVESLRRPMEKVTAFILAAGGIKEKGTVVAMPGVVLNGNT